MREKTQAMSHFWGSMLEVDLNQLPEAELAIERLSRMELSEAFSTRLKVEKQYI